TDRRTNGPITICPRRTDGQTDGQKDNWQTDGGTIIHRQYIFKEKLLCAPIFLKYDFIRYPRVVIILEPEPSIHIITNKS
ncbi:hypothetical protein DPMN_138662, partial [Dreissena polymorpha]